MLQNHTSNIPTCNSHILAQREPCLSPSQRNASRFIEDMPFRTIMSVKISMMRLLLIWNKYSNWHFLTRPTSYLSLLMHVMTRRFGTQHIQTIRSRKHDLFGHLMMQNSNIGYSIPACAILSHPRTYLSKQKHQYGMAIGFYYVPIPKP